MRIKKKKMKKIYSHGDGGNEDTDNRKCRG